MPYNKYTSAMVQRVGCGQCGQKRGDHASYCPFNPERQQVRTRMLERALLESLLERIATLEAYVRRQERHDPV